MSEETQKKIFSRNLLKYIDISQKKQKEIADAIGVSPQTFNTWCQGIALPRMGKVQALADYFHINKSDLIEDKESTLYVFSANKFYNSDDGHYIIEAYRMLSPDGRNKLIERIDELLKLEGLSEYRPTRNYSSSPNKGQQLLVVPDQYSEEVNAAHAENNTSTEDIEHDNKIMDEENF